MRQRVLLDTDPLVAFINCRDRRYQSVPMSLADACLVRMAQQYSESFLLTLDSDFRIYRKNRNQVIPVIIPEERN